jgi:hypothetical protein
VSVAVRRRRAVVAAVALLLVAGLAVLAMRAFGGDEPPATGAAKLAPKDTLVFVHVSTDPERGAVERASDLLGRFDSYAGYRDAILQRLVGTEGKVSAKDVEPWLGDEAALALVDAGQATAGSLVIVRVTDEGKARRFLERNPRRSAVRRYKGARIDEFGAVNVAFADGYLLIGQPGTVNAALDRSNGRGDALADDATYRAATKQLPAGRAADAFVTAAGLRRLLVPQGDVLGSLAVMLEQPGLKAVALSAEAEDDGLRLVARSQVDAATQKRSGGLKAFEPSLVDAAPKDALAYLGVSGVSGTLGNLVAAAAGGANAGGVGPLLGRLRSELGKQTGGALERDLLKLFEGEVAVVLNQATPAPTLALVTKTDDEDGTAAVLRRLQDPLVKLLTPKGEQAPRWRSDDVGDGVRAQTLATPTGAEVSYAVFEGRLVLGTGPDAIRRIKDADDDLGDNEAFEDVSKERRDQVTSLGFLDFTQLLELGEQTGLNDSRAYLAARDDLRRITAVGVSSHATEGETTAEILLSIR